MNRHPRQAAVPVERFLIKLDMSGSCWIWTASRNESGYGKFKADGRMHLAHRWLYECLIAPIPAGLDLDHTCRNRACVRPSHLEPVTHRENLLRGETINARNASKTHCANGHAFVEENTRITKAGHRSCRTCAREETRSRRLARQSSDA